MTGTPGRSTITRRQSIKGLLAVVAGAASLPLLVACQPAAPAQPTSPPAPSAAPQPTAAPAPTQSSAAQATAAPSQAPAAKAPAAPSAPPTQAAPAKATTGAKPGGSIVTALHVDPIDLDPHKNSYFGALLGYEHVYESLVAFGDELKIVPALAESWELSPDGLQYVFKLRQGAKFHNGKEFEAADVVAWKERVFAKETAAPFKGWYDAIDRVEAVDKYTAKFTLRYPYAPLLANMASRRGSGIPQRDWAQSAGDAMKTTAVGTGPYRITSFVPYDQVTWERNQDYYQKGIPYIEKIVNKIMVEEDSRVAGLRAGNLHYGWVGAEGAQRLASDTNSTVLRGRRAFTYFLQMNCSKAPFDNPKVRQAIMLATDLKEHIEKDMGGEAELTGPVPTGLADWFIPAEKLPDSLLKVDIPRAKQLLAEAGYPNGFKTTVKTQGAVAWQLGISVVAKSQLEKIGIEVEVIQMESGQWLKETQPPTSDYYLRPQGFSFLPDPDAYLYNSYHSKSTSNSSRYSNSKLDEMMEKARQLVSHEERKKLYYEIQDLVLTEAIMIPLWNATNLEGVSKKLRDYRQSFTGSRLFLPQAWWEG